MPTPINTNFAFRQLAREVAVSLIDLDEVAIYPTPEAVRPARASLRLLDATETPVS